VINDELYTRESEFEISSSDTTFIQKNLFNIHIPTYVIFSSKALDTKPLKYFNVFLYTLEYNPLTHLL